MPSAAPDPSVGLALSATALRASGWMWGRLMVLAGLDGSTSKEPLFTVTSVITEHFIRPTGPDLWVDIIFHVTVNGNGSTTTHVSMERVRCH